MASIRRKGTECEGVACEHVLGQQPLQLYGYLWSKASGRNGDCGKDTFSFVLADTVVFKNQKPVKWFFTSKQERGKILCKTKKFLSIERVLQEFLVPKRVSNIQPRLDDGGEILASYAYLDRSTLYGESHMIVEHLDKGGIERLLEGREMPALSVLQRFVPTKSGYNHTVRSVHTAENCTIQKCISPFLLSDTKASIAKRTATFELNDPVLRHRDVTDREVQSTIEKINAEVSAHLEAIVGKEMDRIVSFFKIGADNQIYLLWSSMIAFDAGNRSTAKNYHLALENHATTGVMMETDSEMNHAAKSSIVGCNSHLKVCPNCNRTLPRDQVEYVVSHRSIIQQFETEKSTDEDGDPIPTLLRAISGPIQAERFKQLKQTALYLYQTVQLCLPCARQFDASANTSNSHHHRNNLQASRDPENSTNNHDQNVSEDTVRRCAPTKKEEPRQPQKPVVVKSRAASAGAMRMCFSKNNARGGSYQYQRHFHRFLPRLHAFDPPELTSRDGVLQLALHLRRKYGHPSLRFALSQCNVFPVGSTVSLRAMAGVCTHDLLIPVAKYWAALFHVQVSSRSLQSVDIDAIDGLLAACLKPSHQLLRPAPQDPRKRTNGPIHSMQAVEPSRPVIHRPSSAPVCVPKRPDRPRSGISKRVSSHRTRLLSLASGETRDKPSDNNADPAPLPSDVKMGPSVFVRIVDGVKCLVRVSARSQTGGEGDCVLHLEATQLLNSDSNQTSPAMELMLTTTEIMALVGTTDDKRHLDSQAALLASILPLVQIRDAQLRIPSLQQQQQQQQQPQPHHIQPTLQQSQRLDRQQWRQSVQPPQRSNILSLTLCPDLSDMERLLLAETLAKDS